MDRIGLKGKSTSNLIATSFGTAGLAIGAAIATGIKQGVTSFSELERKMLRTKSLIHATGNAAKLSSDQLLSLANRVDAQTLADRDGVLSAINALQTFKSVSGEVFERSIMLANDLAEVMGGDIRTQTVQLGKALQDPVRGLTALRRVGVDFTAQQREQITVLAESGRSLEAQGKILDAIQGQVGGAAAGAAGGLTGQMDGLNFQWRAFTETLAGSTGAITATGRGIEYLSNTLAGLSAWLSGPTAKDSLSAEIERLEAAFAKNPDWSGYVADNLRRRLAGAKAGMAELLNPTNMEADWGGGSGVAVAVGSDVSGGGGADKAEVATGTYLDSWMDVEAAEARAVELYEVKSNYWQALIDLDAENMEAANAMELDFWQMQIGYRNKMLDKDIRLQQRYEKTILGIKQQSSKHQQAIAFQLGTALLTTVGAGADAIFVAQKAFDVGLAIMGGHAAAAKALAEVPYPYNLAVSAEQLSLGYWHAAAIAATGIGQLVASHSGSTGGGTHTSPVVTTSSSTSASNASTGLIDPAFTEPEERGTLTINIEGDMIGDETYIDNLVEKINEAREDRDVTVNYS